MGLLPVGKSGLQAPTRVVRAASESSKSRFFLAGTVTAAGAAVAAAARKILFKVSKFKVKVLKSKC